MIGRGRAGLRLQTRRGIYACSLKRSIRSGTVCSLWVGGESVRSGKLGLTARKPCLGARRPDGSGLRGENLSRVARSLWRIDDKAVTFLELEGDWHDVS